MTNISHSENNNNIVHGDYPKHIAIIMDGNGRWARKRLLPRVAGHKSGVKVVRNIVQYCAKHSIGALTIFAFSSENWKRPKKEVGSLMELFFTALEKEVKSLNENNVCMQFIGDRTVFSKKLQNKISSSEQLTQSNSGLKLSVAANYGGRWDITNAAKQLVNDIEQGKLSKEDINEESLSQRMSLNLLPEPDLFIRTGGEERISNFLLWQLAYTELYFTKTLWPDFTEVEIEKAIQNYIQRQRRFGHTGEQVDQLKNA
ncbi:Undecaprenyl diphosphate synthase [hydrothermal vent metagenome]|uniref:Undecaprenyl diphosphate synthase n=1 Tax=hydrothermal vent metagenome TaxID=652676 RepID=A0A3B0ZNW3_9ZZZZ